MLKKIEGYKIYMNKLLGSGSYGKVLSKYNLGVPRSSVKDRPPSGSQNHF